MISVSMFSSQLVSDSDSVFSVTVSLHSVMPVCCSSVDTALALASGSTCVSLFPAPALVTVTTFFA